MCSSILPCSLIHVDARVLCEAAGSLKKLKLRVKGSCTSDAIAEVFGYRPLEELVLTLLSVVEVSNACSSGILYGYVVWTLKDHFT